MVVKKSLLLGLLFSMLFSVSNATQFYVNGVIGSDSLKDYTGLTAAKPYKSISKAIGKCETGDRIIIAGEQDGKKITYFENLKIDGKNEIYLKGIGKPIINGSQCKTSQNIGLQINADFVQVDGLVFSDFIGGNMPCGGLRGGAAILTSTGNTNLVIKDNEVRNCNWGIVLFESEVVKVQSNKIESISKIDNTYKGGGVGILLWSQKHFLQGNEIGCGGGNTVNRADRYGLLIGSSDTVILSEMTKIENNNFNENNVGMCVSNITGIVNIKNNTFNKNSAGIEIIGFSNDTYWGNNIFKGSTGNSEMISSESYDGSMFYDIWRNNDNKFSIDTYSQVDEAMSAIIISPDGKRHVRNKIEEAQKDNPKGGKPDKRDAD